MLVNSEFQSTKQRLAEGKRTIFQEEWWLQAASGGKINRISIESSGKDIAYLYFVERRVFGLKIFRMPPYTRTLGPVLDFSHRDLVSKSYKRDVLVELISKIPKNDYFYQTFGPEDESAVLFDLHGFSVGISYTFRIPAKTDVEGLWAGIDSRRRKRILARRRDLCVQHHTDIERFVRLARGEYSSDISSYDFAGIERIFEAANARKQTRIISASNASNQDVCTAVVVWDHDALYFWLGARDHKQAGRGAKSLVVWEAINLASKMGLTFDFDSYFSPSGANFVLTFGLRPVVRPAVSKAALSARLAFTCRDLLRGIAR